jgi:hypothetical protein
MCRVFINLTLIFFMTLTGVYAGNRLNAKWENLFDGKTLEGWEQKGGTADYQIIDETIVGTTVLNTPNSFLCTKTTYGNFILELEFLVDENLNSGIQIRSRSIESYKEGQVHGLQVEIDPSERAWTAGLYEEGRRGWLYDLRLNEAARAAFKQNEWNKLHIEAIGPSVRTWINDVPAANLIDDAILEGFIALQVHGSKKAGLQVKWRQIRILDLGTANEFPPVIYGKELQAEN